MYSSIRDSVGWMGLYTGEDARAYIAGSFEIEKKKIPAFVTGLFFRANS